MLKSSQNEIKFIIKIYHIKNTKSFGGEGFVDIAIVENVQNLLVELGRKSWWNEFDRNEIQSCKSNRFWGQ